MDTLIVRQEQRLPPRSTYRAPSAAQRITGAEAFGELAPSELLKAPPELYVAGDLSLMHAAHKVAIVGSRAPSPEGRQRSAKLASLLARAGVTVVSGLAKGIDREAHEAAILAGGRTIAVIGTPLDRAYPAENAPLQEKIYREHLLVSQFPQGQRVFPSNFIARNRTMALIAHASVIVEAGETSGSLSQAAETQRLGHPLFIMESVVKNPGLTWPQKFLEAGAIALHEVGQILSLF